ncbi:MAG: response regulator transcription factor [Oscillospiraceae bacterium]|nr:response regulator transcription factor [Oscillospiraceae bacterium]
MTKKLLIVEDDRNISFIISENAKLEGYERDVAYDGEDGLEKALKNVYDLILLDLMLPKIEGFDICRRIRQANITTPVIILTAREEEIDKITGLELGADDYITKPFSVKELFARVKANIRRSSSDSGFADSDSGGNTNIINIRSVAIDCGKRRVEKNSVTTELSRLEYDLLVFLAKNPDRIFSREELLKNVWKYDIGGDFYGDPRTVDVTVKRLRDKIEDDASNPEIILNKRGVGYYLTNSD